MKLQLLFHLLAALIVQNCGARHHFENELLGFSSRHKINSPAAEIHDEIDILKLMNVSAKDQGVSLVEGPIPKYPAYKFRLPYENVPLSNSSAIIDGMSSRHGFTAVFLYRQQKNNLGTLISVNSPGRLTPSFQVNSNMKTNMLTFKYILSGSPKLHQIDWKLPTYHKKSPLAGWIWVSLSIDYDLATVRLDLDCEPSRFESLSVRKAKARISVPQDSLVYLRQEPGRKKKFLGSMQVAKILPYITEQRLWNCMHISNNLSSRHRKPLVA